MRPTAKAQCQYNQRNGQKDALDRHGQDIADMQTPLLAGCYLKGQKDHNHRQRRRRPGELSAVAQRFQKILKSKEIGYHGHNNQQMGFSNTIEAIIHNANYLDGSVYGIGRAAGNCPLELLIGFLKNPKYDIRPILDLISKELVPLSDKIEWGYLIPYAITGMLNEHPRTAMALRNSEQKDEYRDFYETMVNQEMD